MKTYKINKILRFIRTNDTAGLYRSYSNRKVRDYIYACLKKKAFTFFHKDKELIGIVEWYRVINEKYIVDRFLNKQYLYNYPNGDILWINNAIFKSKELTLKIYKDFLNTHKDAKKIMWWRFKNNKLMKYQLRRK